MRSAMQMCQVEGERERREREREKYVTLRESVSE